MASLTCLFCRQGYTAPHGQSTCPSCGRLNVHSSLLSFWSPNARPFVVIAVILALLVVVGMVLNA